MKKFIKKSLVKLFSTLVSTSKVTTQDWDNKQLVLAARSIMESSVWQSPPPQDGCNWLASKEFSVYSQFGDDGIIQYLCYLLQLENKSFIEFGVGDFFESNCHFLLIHNNWSGFVMDGSHENMETLRQSSIYWRQDITGKAVFVTIDNINELLAESGFDRLGLMHIDLDGNDYWILQAIDLSNNSPDLLILEYNAHFGCERPISIPYDSEFYRMSAHYSGQFFGASLPALNYLANLKGYYFIGCNSAGNNAYFLANRHQKTIPAVSLLNGFVEPKFRDSRNQQGVLDFMPRSSAVELIRGLPVVNVVMNANELF